MIKVYKIRIVKFRKKILGKIAKIVIKKMMLKSL